MADLAELLDRVQLEAYVIRGDYMELLFQAGGGRDVVAAALEDLDVIVEYGQELGPKSYDLSNQRIGVPTQGADVNEKVVLADVIKTLDDKGIPKLELEAVPDGLSDQDFDTAWASQDMAVQAFLDEVRGNIRGQA